MIFSESGVIKIHRVSQHVYKKQTPWFESTSEIIPPAFISASRKRRGFGKNCIVVIANHDTRKLRFMSTCLVLPARNFAREMKFVYRTCSTPIEPRVRRSSDGVSRLNDDVTRRTELATLPNVTHPRRTTPGDLCGALVCLRTWKTGENDFCNSIQRKQVHRCFHIPSYRYYPYYPL